MPNTMVIGGSGRVGSFITRMLVEQGARPVIFDISPHTRYIKDVATEVKLVKGDTTDLAQYIRAIKENEIEYIIDTVYPLGSGHDLWYKFRVAVDGFANGLEAARITDIKGYAFTSTKAVYGQITGEHGPPNYKPMPEEVARPGFGATTSQTLTYAGFKRMSELYGLAYNRDYGLDFKACRLAHNYGPFHSEFGLVDSVLVENAMLGIPTEIPCGGDAKMDWVYYEDIAQGLIKACFGKNPPSRIYNLGTGEGYTIGDWAEIPQRHLSRMEDKDRRRLRLGNKIYLCP